MIDIYKCFNITSKHASVFLDEKLNKFEDRVRNMLQEKEGIFGDTVLVKFDEIKNNGINVLVSSYTDSVDRYKVIFREIFIKMDHKAHYDMMMSWCF